MTNDARQTKNRQQKTLNEARIYQHKIINFIRQKTSRSNIIILESPPLLQNDIYPYNRLSYETSKLFGLRFAPTLVGEQHLWEDGVHILHNCRPLLINSVAAAILGKNPLEHFKLARPPHGAYGPWTAPFGFRPAPSRFPPPFPLWHHHGIPGQAARTTANVAAAPAFYFRHRQAQALTGIQPRIDRHS